MTRTWKRYILWFAQEHVQFRESEFNSITTLFQLKWKKVSTDDTLKPYWIVEFPNDDAALQFASRSIALRGMFELWAHSTHLPNFHHNLREYVQTNASSVDQYFDRNCSFKIVVETYNKHLSHANKIDRIESMDYLPIRGDVDLKSPQVEWWYFEYWGPDSMAVPEAPLGILFGRLLSLGQRHLIKELSLKQRKFIGNTSMDAQLSLLMANQALVQGGDFVFDPFVGTGSLLVSAAKFGAYVLGADIDFMMVHARCRPSRITQKVRDQDESIRANLKQYGCADRYIDVVVADFSNPLWQEKLKFDSIITDPPYGIREATERVELKLPSKQFCATENMQHYPSTSHYGLQHLYTDLLNFAAKHLKLSGRLVCWLPFHKQDYTDKMLPRHANLTLIANSEQPLMGQTARRLLTYVKHSEPGEESADEQAIVDDPNVAAFRNRYFDMGAESRQQWRMRRAAQRESDRMEALKRGKEFRNGKELKCTLNKARFE